MYQLADTEAAADLRFNNSFICSNCFKIT